MSHLVPKQSSEISYRPELDGLRGLAILAVLGFHAFPERFPGGFVGVDVFLVLSGFLITALILEQRQRSTFRLVQFYARRARRLFPALIIVLAACLLFGWFALLPDELKSMGKHVATAATFSVNFSLWHEAGYFDRATALKPLMHLWSLSVEEQFYLLWPLALLLMLRWRGHKSTAVIVALVAASFVLNLALSLGHPRADFYFPMSRFWELGLGCAWAFLTHGPEESRWRLDQISARGARPDVRSWLPAALPVLGVALILGTTFLFHSHMAFPGYAGLVPAAGALCVIAAPRRTWFQQHVMASKALVFIGLVSYPLYLWHWPVLSFATILGSGAVPAIVRLEALLLSFVLACAVFWLVERPIRAQRARRVYAPLGCGLLALGAAGLTAYSMPFLSHRFGPEADALKQGVTVNDKCRDIFPGARDFNYCKSNSLKSPAVIVMGDSRAQAVYDGVASQLGRRYPLMLLGRGGCPPILNVRVHESVGGTESCAETWDSFVRYVHELQPEVVVLVGGGADYLQDVRPEKRGAPSPPKQRMFKSGLADLIANLDDTSQVIYVRELPSFDTPPSCFVRHIKVWWGQCAPTVARETVEAHMAPYNQAVDAVHDELPGLHVVSSIPAVCNSTYCSQKLRSGVIQYRDELHLSAAGGRRFAATSGLSATILRTIEVSRFEERPTRAAPQLVDPKRPG